MAAQVEEKKLPKFKPGDKIYKLFNYDKVIIMGNKEDFIINIKKRK